MARFLYVGDDRRDFPAVPVTVDPGDEIEADENPHPVYFTVVKAPKPAPVQED